MIQRRPSDGAVVHNRLACKTEGMSLSLRRSYCIVYCILMYCVNNVAHISFWYAVHDVHYSIVGWCKGVLHLMWCWM